MAQTTWYDAETRRSLLEGLSALAEGSAPLTVKATSGRSVVGVLTIALGVVVAVALR
jgi:hypothetical protein